MSAYLTIDDAPSPDLPAKLDLLAEHAVPALLFCEGRRLEDHADLAREAVEAGVHLGNHTYTHTHASLLLPSAFRDEVARTENAIDAVYDDAGVDRPARVFRFPYGDRGRSRAPRFQHVLSEFGFEAPDPPTDGDDGRGRNWESGRDWGWTLDLQDWGVESPAELRAKIEATVDGRTPSTPDVVLFHDSGTDLALLETLLEAFDARGIEFGDPLDLL